jgi:acyl-coenzyme A synthetase/AMP-(fatty) acid ligase
MPQDSIEIPTSFSQLFAQQAHENREKTWIYYPEPITAEKYRCLTYGGADKLMSHLAAVYQELMPEATNETVSKTAPKLLDSPPMVVATMASNNVQCLLTGLASQRLGHPYIHISHLNSDIGIVSLLKSVDARVLIADSVFIDRAKSLALDVEGLHVISMIDFDPIDELKKPLRSFNTDTSSNELSKCCLIMHTSGTTNSAPKPMWHNYKGFLQTHPFVTGTTVLTTGRV